MHNTIHIRRLIGHPANADIITSIIKTEIKPKLYTIIINSMLLLILCTTETDNRRQTISSIIHRLSNCSIFIAVHEQIIIIDGI